MQAPSSGSDTDDRLLRLRQVLEIVPISKSAWYKGVAGGRFPPGVKLSSRTVAWRKSDIEALVRSLCAPPPA